MDRIENKSLPLEGGSLAADVEGREIRAYASVFGNVDLDGDVVERGAFKQTLQERLPKGLIKYFGFHRKLIGVLRHAEEDQVGLMTVGKVSKTRAGDEVLELAKDGALTHMSFAYQAIQAEKGKMPDGRLVRRLKSLRLLEVGPVDFPANEEAAILSVKSALRGRKDLWPLAELIGTAARLDQITDDESPRIEPDDALVALEAIGKLLPEGTPMRARIEAFLASLSAGDANADAGSDAASETEEAAKALRAALLSRTPGGQVWMPRS